MSALAPHYYNEIDPYCVQWLKNLIAAKLLQDGEVDDRRIETVDPDDLRPFRQCHFFAGIGGWALAARLAGWPLDHELWSGSVPCQPFSHAGKRKAQADDRHLWPHQFRLIRARRPAGFVGEQVAAAIGRDWLDGVAADLESIDYARGTVVLPACAVDAPHRRDRAWIVAYPKRQGLAQRVSDQGIPRSLGGEPKREDAADDVAAGRALAYADMPKSERLAVLRGSSATASNGLAAGRDRSRAGVMADSDGEQLRALGSPEDAGAPGTREVEGSQRQRLRPDVGHDREPLADSDAWRQPEQRQPKYGEFEGAPGDQPDRRGSWGFWDGAVWLVGHDGKARRVKPGIRLLAHGVPSRVGRLRAYGNTIVPQVAAEVIAALMETMPC
jgi:DNA (cytosine-5)-methyltransferase 1